MNSYMFGLVIFLSFVNIKNAEFNFQQSLHQISCDSLRNKGIKHFGQGNFTDAKDELLLAADCYKINQNAAQAGFAYLNIATIHDEGLINIDSTLRYIQLSLNANKDSMHQANILKYQGLILSKQGKFVEGLEKIDRSKNLFAMLGFEPGVYVAEFDKAHLYYNMTNYKACKISIDDVRRYLLAKNKMERLFLLNLLEIKWAYAVQNSESISNTIKENEKILSETDVYKSNIDTFEIYKVKYSFTKEK